jgi:hypothetical protein
VSCLQGLEDWQQPLAKIAVDQTALSLAWNSMYFGLLGAMRLDPPGQVPLFSSLMSHADPDGEAQCVIPVFKLDV